MPTARVSYPCSGEVTPELPGHRTNRGSHEIDVLILGGGPAGLSVGLELKQRGLPFLILEKGPTVGETWANMPRALKLVSPWKSNSLPGTPSNLFRRHDQLTREQFLNYLRAYAKNVSLPVQSDTEVLSVEKLPDGLFRVRTSQGDLFSRLVVNATGYFSNPFVPQIPGAKESQIPQLHFADYRDPQELASLLNRPNPQQPASGSPSPLKGERPAAPKPGEGGAGVRGEMSPSRPILIVGKRLSAGQIMVELVEAGFAVALSHRSPINYGAEPWAWWFLFRIFPWLEWVKLQLKGSRAPSNDVRMPGGAGRKLIASGKVKTFPAIQQFDHDAVTFTNGEQLQPALVLFATGFRPALGHLAPMNVSICAETGRPQLHDLESVSVPGLFFIGLDHARNFQSRFLRGIRKDAAFLAERLEQISGEANRPAPILDASLARV